MDVMALVWLGALSVPAFVAWRTWGLLRLNLKVGMNNDRFAQSTFIELLDEADRKMWICDDGNAFPESIYNAEAVVEAVWHRLEENRELHLYCLFSSNDNTRFTKAFDGHPQVHMDRGVQPRRDVHFKIIDDARKGYVSAHPPRVVRAALPELRLLGRAKPHPAGGAGAARGQHRGPLGSSGGRRCRIVARTAS